jgi:hypothetical protein
MHFPLVLKAVSDQADSESLVVDTFDTRLLAQPLIHPVTEK